MAGQFCDIEVPGSDESAGSLRFERRHVDRWPLDGAASAFRLGGEHFGQIHEMKMLDYSHDGMGAISDEVVEPGTMLSIGFAKPGYPAKRGVVVRCQPTGNGYRVSVRFDRALAA